MTYDAFPICGDGVDVGLTLHRDGQARAAVAILQQAHELQRGSKPVRNRVQKKLGLLPGDQLEVVIEPRGTHDCDGIYIVELEVWEAREQM